LVGVGFGWVRPPAVSDPLSSFLAAATLTQALLSLSLVAFATADDLSYGISVSAYVSALMQLRVVDIPLFRMLQHTSPVSWKPRCR